MSTFKNYITGSEGSLKFTKSYLTGKTHDYNPFFPFIKQVFSHPMSLDLVPVNPMEAPNVGIHNLTNPIVGIENRDLTIDGNLTLNGDLTFSGDVMVNDQSFRDYISSIISDYLSNNNLILE